MVYSRGLKKPQRHSEDGKWKRKVTPWVPILSFHLIRYKTAARGRRPVNKQFLVCLSHSDQSQPWQGRTKFKASLS